MGTVSLQLLYRLGFFFTAASANVVSTHGAHTQVEVTSAGEVVRTNSNRAVRTAPNHVPQPLMKVADGIQKRMAAGFDTETTHKEADSYLLGGDDDTIKVDKLTESKYTVPEPEPYMTTLVNQGNGSFYTTSLCFGVVAKGEKPMCLPGIPDTGSFELVVRSARCKKCTPPFYNDSMSLTFVEHIDKKNHTQLMYGSGPVNALWVRDTVAIEGSHDAESNFFSPLTGSTPATGIIVPQQTLLETTSTPIKDFARGMDMCGIYGIGRGVSEGRSERFIQRAGIRRYSICLPRDDHKNGTMWWGTPDPAKNSMYTPINVVGQFHWAVELTHMKLNYQKKSSAGKVESITTGKSCAILDSGTTLIQPTPEMALKLFAAIEMQGLNCKDTSNLPTLDFELDGKPYRLPPEAYVANVGMVDANVSHITSKLFKFDPNAGCMLLLTQPMPELPSACPSMVLGMPFFRFYKTIFDWDAKSVKNTTDRGMVYTAEHSDCEDGYNSWDVTAENYIGKSMKSIEKGSKHSAPESPRKLMTIDLKKIKFPKAPAHYFQHGKL
eukprot:gnl/MRDRNA2_/MRDRNA2_102315_c0_seq1.p1 gnl/MRDRNA2_/MRDRNA2_102315_c0~~gnl/MRDRNA2_/MRDRNA2_102315_c0_seq1.p1  ORF type:complete len:551 (+),score=83.10 gnl/MRDRNA2_/MRDRNA2_102315_c0_seq1:93-1745(+)